MNRGFTILELLVASLLLGMLMTVLTMIFNQSSISWRVGEAAVADLDKASDQIASTHAIADNLYVWNGTPYVVAPLWEGNTRRTERPIEASVEGTDIFKGQFTSVGKAVKDANRPGAWTTVSISSDESSGSRDTFTVNVMSAGPDRTFNNYDDIWSFPYDFD